MKGVNEMVKKLLVLTISLIVISQYLFCLPVEQNKETSLTKKNPTKSLFDSPTFPNIQGVGLDKMMTARRLSKTIESLTLEDCMVELRKSIRFNNPLSLYVVLVLGKKAWNARFNGNNILHELIESVASKDVVGRVSLLLQPLARFPIIMNYLMHHKNNQGLTPLDLLDQKLQDPREALAFFQRNIATKSLNHEEIGLFAYETKGNQFDEFVEAVTADWVYMRKMLSQINHYDQIFQTLYEDFFEHGAIFLKNYQSCHESKTYLFNKFLQHAVRTNNTLYVKKLCDEVPSFLDCNGPFEHDGKTLLEFIHENQNHTLLGVLSPLLSA